MFLRFRNFTCFSLTYINIYIETHIEKSTKARLQEETQKKHRKDTEEIQSLSRLWILVFLFFFFFRFGLIVASLKMNTRFVLWQDRFISLIQASQGGIMFGMLFVRSLELALFMPARYVICLG